MPRHFITTTSLRLLSLMRQADERKKTTNGNPASGAIAPPSPFKGVYPYIKKATPTELVHMYITLIINSSPAGCLPSASVAHRPSSYQTPVHGEGYECLESPRRQAHLALVGLRTEVAAAHA